MIDEAERLTRDVLLTLSNGPFYSTTLFLEFPCVASALVHFSTLLSLCFYFFFSYYYFFPPVSFTSFYFGRVDLQLKNRSLAYPRIAYHRNRAQYACNEISTLEITASLSANFVDFTR